MKTYNKFNESLTVYNIRAHVDQKKKKNNCALGIESSTCHVIFNV